MKNEPLFITTPTFPTPSWSGQSFFSIDRTVKYLNITALILMARLLKSSDDDDPLSRFNYLEG